MQDKTNRALARKQAVRERWRDALALLMGGCGAGVLMLRIIDCDALLQFGMVKLSAVAFVTISISWRWLRLRLRPLLGIQYLQLYPSIWMPALAGSVVSIGCGLLLPELLLSKSCAPVGATTTDVLSYFGFVSAIALFLWVFWVGG